jgi:hypothetical protein
VFQHQEREQGHQTQKQPKREAKGNSQTEMNRNSDPETQKGEQRQDKATWNVREEKMGQSLGTHEN